jgi:hypothetical protein
MRFHCPLCDSVQIITTPVDPSWKVQCAECRKAFQWSNDLIVPYCYACESEEVTTYHKTPIGTVFACAEHSAHLGDFWLLPMIKFGVTSGNHARQYDGSPSGSSGGGGTHVKRQSAGK